MVCEPFHQGATGHRHFPMCLDHTRTEPEKNTDDRHLKRKWGMGGTKTIESAVEAMPQRSDVESMPSGAIGTDSFDTN